MRPVDHMKPSEDEIIAHIKDSLSSYEESYVPGSWERFDRQQGHKPGMLLWIGRLSSAAALLILGSLLFWYVAKSPRTQPDKNLVVQSQDPAVTKQDHAGNDVAQSKVQVDEIEFAKASLSPVKSKQTSYVATVVVTDQPVNLVAAQHTMNVAQIPVESSLESVTVKTIPLTGTNPVEEVDSKSALEAFLKAESKNTARTASNTPVEKGNKWAVGVMVSPSIGSTNKINMGYGLSMGYAITDKVSLNSGISYNELAASRNVAPVAAPASTAIAGESKSLESVEQRVTGIDIPLDIRYNLGKNLYANVGVSAFAVIDQRRNNTYLQEKVVERASYDSPASNDFKNLILNEKVTEDAPVSEIDHNKYIGFYNFSFGYKQKVAKDKSISIEPFMKVPMKEITRDNLRLMGTGIKLRFDF